MTLRKLAIMAGAGVFMAIPAFASADFSFDFNTVISGDTPGGSAPWANLSGTQNGDDVDFVLTFNASADPDTASEFLGALDLAYDGDLSGSTMVESEAGIVGYSVGDHTNASLDFSAIVDFNNPNNGDRVMRGDSVSFTLTDVDADLFTNFLLHIQGTGVDGEGSSKVSVPEPASMAALGMGALGLLARRRRNKK
jgi:hypothetical protein